MADEEKKVEESARTKMIRTMPDNILQKGALWLSEKLDKAGLKQEKEYEGKTKEELAVKKRAGGTVSSASKRADGCAQRGKTRGRMV